MEGTRPKILILYASYGEGHLQAARALRQSFVRQGADNVALIDLMAEAHPLLNGLTRFIYLKSSALFPRLYGWSYYWTQHIRPDRLFLRVLNSMGMRQLKKRLLSARPDAVIHTFPLPVVPGLQTPGGRPLPTYTVMTDFTLHQRWIRPGVTRYYTATEDLREALQLSGVEAGKIRTTGIPIRDAFNAPPEPGTLLARYKLDESMLIVCVMAGAYGVLGKVAALGARLLAIEGVQLLFICGKNEPLRQQLEAAFGGHARARIYGYVEQIEEVMAISSVLITKAGGITLSEAIALCLPVIVFNPLPGQEKENARYLAGQGAVDIVHDPETLSQRIELLALQREALLKRKEAMRALRARHAADVIASDVLGDMAPAAHEGFGE